MNHNFQTARHRSNTENPVPVKIFFNYKNHIQTPKMKAVMVKNSPKQKSVDETGTTKQELAYSCKTTPIVLSDILLLSFHSHTRTFSMRNKSNSFNVLTITTVNILRRDLLANATEKCLLNTKSSQLMETTRMQNAIRRRNCN